MFTYILTIKKKDYSHSYGRQTKYIEGWQLLFLDLLDIWKINDSKRESRHSKYTYDYL